jgi:hypothetical protein
MLSAIRIWNEDDSDISIKEINSNFVNKKEVTKNIISDEKKVIMHFNLSNKILNYLRVSFGRSKYINEIIGNRSHEDV